MTIPLKKMLLLAVAAVCLTGGLLWNGSISLDGAFVTSAEARIGRPLTPMSYAGVARRTTRRAVAVGAAGVAAGAYYGSSCAQVVDAYGRVVTRC
jgi:hypothetical protein